MLSAGRLPLPPCAVFNRGGSVACEWWCVALWRGGGGAGSEGRTAQSRRGARPLAERQTEGQRARRRRRESGHGKERQQRGAAAGLRAWEGQPRGKEQSVNAPFPSRSPPSRRKASPSVYFVSAWLSGPIKARSASQKDKSVLIIGGARARAWRQRRRAHGRTERLRLTAGDGDEHARTRAGPRRHKAPAAPRAQVRAGGRLGTHTRARAAAPHCWCRSAAGGRSSAAPA